MYCEGEERVRKGSRAPAARRAHHRDQVHVASASPAPKKRASDSSSSKNHNLDGMSVLGGEAEGSGELVVQPAKGEQRSATALE
jgi:hypothetical protein